MSKIGKKPIIIPSGAAVTIADSVVTVKGAKGELQVSVPANILVVIEENLLKVSRSNEEKATKSLHGLVRSLISNAIIGVTEGYRKTLKLVGTGYKVAAKGAGVSLALGYSHPVDVEPVTGVKLTIEGQDTIHVDGISKEAVGQVAANIRSMRPPEPYLGKGIRYSDEVVRRKAGKAAAG
jgi:large subunit ribosomal protein L6